MNAIYNSRKFVSIRYSSRDQKYYSALENEKNVTVLVRLSVLHEKMGEGLESINKCFSMQVIISYYL